MSTCMLWSLAFWWVYMLRAHAWGLLKDKKSSFNYIYQPMCQMKRLPRAIKITPLILWYHIYPPLLDGAMLVTSIAPHTLARTNRDRFPNALWLWSNLKKPKKLKSCALRHYHIYAPCWMQRRRPYDHATTTWRRSTCIIGCRTTERCNSCLHSTMPVESLLLSASIMGARNWVW
jgi:hypothetical protein